MCTTDRHDGSCPACETDTWIVPSGLTSPDSARPATETRREPEDAPAPALTRDGPTVALGRDGGADPYTRGRDMAGDDFHANDIHRANLDPVQREIDRFGPVARANFVAIQKGAAMRDAEVTTDV